MKCLFVSDLHGCKDRYRSLFKRVEDGGIDVVLLGGDLLPPVGDVPEFISAELLSPISQLRDRGHGIEFFAIMGNDDPRFYEHTFIEADKDMIFHLLHERVVRMGEIFFAGYPFVPPTPFRLKDWERYDVSQHVDPGCVSPLEGYRTLEVDLKRIRYETILNDLEKLSARSDPRRTVYLFHSPPYRTNLDRADLDGIMVDHVPMDLHVGSIAIRRFIEDHSPLITLHGHIHESARITGSWKDTIGDTHMFTAAHDGKELAAVLFDTKRPEEAERELLI
ncbi:MAG: metallophosphoesterase family protein [Thermoplasmatota archaeon]